MDHGVAILKRPRPTYYEKTLGAMRAERTVKRINFVPSEANPSKTLYVFLPKLNKMRPLCQVLWRFFLISF